MKQKFKIYEFVHITKDMPLWMQHFPSDVDAIIRGSYADLYGGNSFKQYSVYLIKNGKIFNSSAWYDEYQLSSLDEQDINKAAMMIEAYHSRHNRDNDES